MQTLPDGGTHLFELWLGCFRHGWLLGAMALQGVGLVLGSAAPPGVIAAVWYPRVAGLNSS